MPSRNMVSAAIAVTAGAGGFKAFPLGASATRPAPVVGPSESTVAGEAREIHDADGIVYGYYAGYGYRFQPLLSFARLNGLISSRATGAARRLASALVARGVRRRGATYWEYDFSYYGSPVPWTSGFVQAVAAQALARTGALLANDSFMRVADASVLALRRTLMMPLGGGLWIREYGFTDTAILNAQLQSLISLESYAKVVKQAAARRVATQVYVATQALLPRFDLGCWSRYSLGGAVAALHYHRYHVELLRRLMTTHAEDPIWRTTYLDWKGCLG